MLVGQSRAKEQADNILKIFAASEGALKPHFWLSGPSGSGKTRMIEYLCHRNSLSMATVNAAQITKEGTSGNSLSKALSELRQKSGLLTVCLVDEADKLFIAGNNNEMAHEVTLGVQNEFLKILEGQEASVFHDYGKYIKIDISRVLFVFAGAWNNAEDVDIDFLRDRGVKTEFLGRVPIVISTRKLKIEELYEILDKSPELTNYLDLFPDQKKDKVVKVIRKFLKEQYEYNTLGARQITGFIHQYFINGGKLDAKEAKKTSFNQKLTFKPIDDNPEQETS